MTYGQSVKTTILAALPAATLSDSSMHAYDYRPLGSHSLWGSEVCPFDLAPRWLTSPSEVSTSLVSASSAGLESLRHTVKLFGTVKARAVVICISRAHNHLLL